MATNYTTFQAQLFNSVAAVSSDTSWQTEFPLIIDRAEQRMYRDLDLIGTRVTDASGATNVQDRIFVLPTSQGTFVVVENVNVITVSSVSSLGTRIPLIPVSKAFIDITYPSNTANMGTPEFFAPRDGQSLLFGPVPDTSYPVEVVGTQRPLPLSVSNSSTILTQLLPDMFFAAGMVEAGMFIRYTEPALGISWQAEYDRLMKGALTEELRKKFFAEGWQSQQPSPIATPPRA